MMVKKEQTEARQLWYDSWKVFHGTSLPIQFLTRHVKWYVLCSRYVSNSPLDGLD